MEALALEIPADERREAVGRLTAWSSRAYQLAVRVLGSAEFAEDVVQQAFLNALKSLPGALPPEEARLWFFRAVGDAARKHLRGELRLKRREAAAMRERPTESPPAARDGELIGELRRAIEGLDEKLRIPIALCYEQNLTQREAAAVLEMPESTVSKRVNEGLAALRQALARAGYPAAPAMVIGALAHTAPAAPASLAAALAKLAASEFTAGAGTTAASVAAKGGLTVKIIAGVVAAGVLAGSVAVLNSVRARRDAPLQSPPAVAEKKSKFDIPIWHPDARWAPPERFAGTPIKTAGELDGPRLEILWREPMAPALASGVTPTSNPQFMSYDAARERYHVTAGSARGCTDGPFSRARFGGWDYSHRYWRWSSPDGRYTYLTEPYNGYRVVRRLDWEKQEVTSIDIGSPVKALAIGEKGQLYMLDMSYKLAICTPDGKVERRLSPEVKETLGSLGWSVAVDEARGRLYAGGFEAKAWYHWYWDLKDGSFHGVLPKPQKDEPQRQKSEAGPFKGTVLYGEGLCYFGPDDPEKRYLYSCRVDTNDVFRLDIEKEHIWGYSGGEGRFISEGVRKSLAGTGGVPNTWLEDGSFVNAYGYDLRAFIYRRTK